MTQVSDLQIYATRQALNGVLIDTEHVPHLRATIKRDSHDNQSHARVEAWTTECGWQTIHSVPVTSLPIGEYSYSYGSYDRETYESSGSVLRRAGYVYWEDQMRYDLNALLAYGWKFFGE